MNAAADTINVRNVRPGFIDRRPPLYRDSAGSRDRPPGRLTRPDGLASRSVPCYNEIIKYYLLIIFF